jgi:protein-S-isoprenylcysteine O-methyltransferase Ste14
MRFGIFRRPRFAFVFPLVIWIFLSAQTTEALMRWGAAIALLGEAIRLWANSYVGHQKVNWTQKWRGDDKIGRLITAGPYAFVRHPLYFGTFLIGAGVCVVVGNPWIAAFGLAGFLIIYGRKMTEEELTLADEGDQEYARYRQQVPRWFPTGRRAANPQGSRSWQGIMASREWKTAIWVVALLIALHLRKEIIQKGELFTADHVIWFVILVLLAASDGIIELVRIRAKRLSGAKGVS